MHSASDWGSPGSWGFSCYFLMPRVDTCEEEATLQRGTVKGWGKRNRKAPLCLLDRRVLMGFVLKFIFKKGKCVIYIGQKTPTLTGENTGGVGSERDFCTSGRAWLTSLTVSTRFLSKVWSPVRHKPLWFGPGQGGCSAGEGDLQTISLRVGWGEKAGQLVELLLITHTLIPADLGNNL